jgi:hypothetical protein
MRLYDYLSGLINKTRLAILLDKKKFPAFGFLSVGTTGESQSSKTNERHHDALQDMEGCLEP